MSSVSWVLFKRCVEGDRKKVVNQANLKPAEGGGARDLRFNPWKKFENVVKQMFPTTKPLKPNDPSDARIIYSAPAHWVENGQKMGPVTIEFWTPTNARPTEGRLARLSTVTPFDGTHLPAASLDPFFMLWLDSSNDVWAQYVTVPDLQQPGWAPTVANPILDAVRTRPTDDNIRGWVNAHNGLSFVA